MITDPQTGLSSAQVAERVRSGQINTDVTVRSKSLKSILYENICTLFNLVNIILAVAVAAVGSYKNMLFMGVVICNLLIGIIQEIRAKRSVDKLSLVAAAKVSVLRSGKETAINRDQVVRDDIMLLKPGSPIAADSVLVSGVCDVNESFITGEADAVTKSPGDKLFAGSFAVSGQGKARAEKVGADNYISRISSQVKYVKPINSEIMTSLKKIIKIISLIIFPVGALLFLNQFLRLGASFDQAVVSTVAALIGMIPEGLMLLTSTVLAVAVIRLSRKRVLVQDLYCIETLARVDVLCLDKTGTITEGRMEYCGVIPFEPNAEQSLSLLVNALEDSNPSIDAVKSALKSEPVRAAHSVPFDSSRKWSGVTIVGKGSIIMGAAEFLPELSPDKKQMLSDYSRDYRVILLMHSKNPLTEKRLPDKLTPLGIILLRDKIRASAPDTVGYFQKQGVTLKVISGDSGKTVSEIAQRVGIQNASEYVDASSLTDRQLCDAADRYTVFGRVTPPQKKLLIRSLQQRGHTVSMTGDGVNDVMALKQADCSIAMASGSEAARNVSELVLIDSDFAAMPEIVARGRQSINNIQRSASLFLVKTIYSAALAILFILIPFSYPFIPIQLTLISALTIGAPSFVLALEPNRERVRGHFISNVLKRALPGGISVVFGVTAANIIGNLIGLTPDMICDISFAVTAVTGLAVLFSICIPFTRLRTVLFAAMTAGLVLGTTLFPKFFALAPFTFAGALLAASLSAVCAAAVYFFYKRFERNK